MMPRPTSKIQLIDQTHTNYDKLQEELALLTPSNMMLSGVVEDWSVKDVIAHLYEWQQMMSSWYEIGKRGDDPITPSPDYTWRQIPELNQHIYETYRDVELDDIMGKFVSSHEAMLTLINSLDDAELFTPNVYTWTKSTTLGSYLTSATCSHYDWATKHIRRWRKAREKAQKQVT